MNPLLQRLPGLDYDGKTTYLRERNGTILFLKAPVRFRVDHWFKKLTATWACVLIFFRVVYIFLEMYSGGKNRINPDAVTLILELAVLAIVVVTCFSLYSFLYDAYRRPERFAIDTRNETILGSGAAMLSGNASGKTIPLSKIEYVLVFRHSIIVGKETILGGYVGIVDKAGRVKPLSMYETFHAAQSDGTTLARLCELPCFSLGPTFEPRELWRFCEPHEQYFGEESIAEKLCRGYGATRDRIAPLAESLFEPRPSKTAVDAKTTETTLTGALRATDFSETLPHATARDASDATDMSARRVQQVRR